MELSDLLDQVPPFHGRKQKSCLEEEWGKPYTDVLKEISQDPVASASIGEVYKGVLHTEK